MSLLNPAPPAEPQLTEAEALALSETGAVPPRLAVFVFVLSWFR